MAHQHTLHVSTSPNNQKLSQAAASARPSTTSSNTSSARFSSPRSARSRATAVKQRQFDIMQRASNHCLFSRHVFVEEALIRPSSSADWIYDEADAMSPHQHQAMRCGAACADELTSQESLALIPYLSLLPESVFVEVGRHCRGRLPLNLALNCKAKAYISICPQLQQAVNASQLASPIIQSDLVHAPVSFIYSEPHKWHYRGATHVLLHNDGAADGVGIEACRVLAAKLSASPSFQLLVTTAPLPFQHHLVHVGDTTLMKLPGAPAPVGPSFSASDSNLGAAAAATAIAAAPSLSSSVNDKKNSNSNSSSSCSGMERAHSALSGLLVDLDHPAKRSVYLYSTSFEAAPAGTLAMLYCQSGVCCLPGLAAHAFSRSRSGGGGSGGGGDRGSSGSGATAPAVPALGAAVTGGLRDDPAARQVGAAVVMSVVLPWLPPLAAHTNAYLDFASTGRVS